jgi:hypothetical protein
MCVRLACRGDRRNVNREFISEAVVDSSQHERGAGISADEASVRRIKTDSRIYAVTEDRRIILRIGSYAMEVDAGFQPALIRIGAWPKFLEPDVQEGLVIRKPGDASIPTAVDGLAGVAASGEVEDVDYSVLRASRRHTLGDIAPVIRGDVLIERVVCARCGDEPSGID